MSEERVHFDAVLQPHRSLSPTGFWLLMAAVAGLSFAAGIAFLLMGAWPIFGFFGLDVALLYVAFRLNYRSGRLVETVRLTERELTVKRWHPGGAVQDWRFEPYWVRIETESEPALILASHGRQLAIARFLTAEERLDLARALADALRRWRGAPHG